MKLQSSLRGSPLARGKASELLYTGSSVNTQEWVCAYVLVCMLMHVCKCGSVYAYVIMCMYAHVCVHIYVHGCLCVCVVHYIVWSG